MADDLIAGLSPDRSRLIVARAGDVLAGWVHLQRHPYPPVAHWGTISHLQTLPAFRGQGMGTALMTSARQIARQEMGLEELHLAARGGMGLERFYVKLGWREIGRWPGALSRSKTKTANVSTALLTGVTAGEGYAKTIVATCRGVPRSSASCVGILWGSPAERGLVGILWASGDCRSKLGQPRPLTLERQRLKHPPLLTVTRDSTAHEPLSDAEH